MSTEKMSITKKGRNLSESYRRFTQKAYPSQRMPMRILACLCNGFLSAYITFIAVFRHFDDITLHWGITVLCGMLLFSVVYQGIKGFVIHFDSLEISCAGERGTISRKIFTAVSALTFAFFMLNFFANYPGGITPENISQWMELSAGELKNWHPAIHTMILWLITRIDLRYTFVIGFQILCFSLLTGYMAATLAAWRVKWFWVFAFVVTVFSIRPTRDILLFASKDTAFSLFALGLTVQLINVVLSDGVWLRKWKNAVAMAVVSAVLSIVRHDGILFTIPLGLLLLLCYAKTTRSAIYVVAASVLITVGITQAVYPLAKVENVPSRTYLESVGMPMTLMSGVLVNNPEALDPLAGEVLGRIADEQTFRDRYVSGDFNSIKYGLPTTDAILSVTPRELLLATWRTLCNAPRESLSQAIALTRIAWDPMERDHRIEVYTEEDARNVVYVGYEVDAMHTVKMTAQGLNRSIQEIVELLTPFRLLSAVGLHLLLLIMAGVYSVNRGLGRKALVLFVPSAVYTFTAMFLLFGPDYRFFHFNVVISLPLIIALLTRRKASPVAPMAADAPDAPDNQPA